MITLIGRNERAWFSFMSKLTFCCKDIMNALFSHSHRYVYSDLRQRKRCVTGVGENDTRQNVAQSRLHARVI